MAAPVLPGSERRFLQPSQAVRQVEQNHVWRIEGVIKHHLLFRGLDAETLRALILSMQERTVDAGAVVISQGEDGDFFYVVDAGALNCYVREEGVEPPGRHVMSYLPGNTFGELALMYNTPRAATIVANEPTVLLAIEREVFRTLILTQYMRKRQVFEDILASVPLLQSMTAYERTVLADNFEEHSFPAGAEIIREGDSVGDDEGKFYILLEGECSATQLDQTSRQSHEVLQYSAGGYFGELALLKDNSQRAASVVAVTDCKCILLDRWSFERLLGPVKEILARDADNYAKHI